MCASKIEEFNLQSQFLPIYNKSNRSYRETAKELTKIAGTNISHMAVKRYIDTLNIEDAPPVPKGQDTKQEVQRKWLEEKDNIINAYQAIINKALTSLNNATDDDAILKAVPVAMKALERAMNHHNIGVNKQDTQVNIQVNFVQDRIKEIAQIIIEECNGSSEAVIRRLELLS